MSVSLRVRCEVGRGADGVNLGGGLGLQTARANNARNTRTLISYMYDQGKADRSLNVSAEPYTERIDGGQAP